MSGLVPSRSLTGYAGPASNGAAEPKGPKSGTAEGVTRLAATDSALTFAEGTGKTRSRLVGTGVCRLTRRPVLGGHATAAGEG